MVASKEYTLELYDLIIDQWIRQVLVGTRDEVERYAEDNPTDDNQVYEMWCIEYDENEEEICSYPAI